MAKKKQTAKVEEPIVEEKVAVEEQPKVEAPKVKAKPKNTWESLEFQNSCKARARTCPRMCREHSTICHLRLSTQSSLAALPRKQTRGASHALSWKCSPATNPGKASRWLRFVSK